MQLIMPSLRKAAIRSSMAMRLPAFAGSTWFALALMLMRQ
jgi:hypothetical protein